MVNVKELVGAVQEAKKGLRDALKPAIRELVKPIFEDPSVVEVRWRQYAPYFNDGDPCVFSVYDPEVQINDQAGDEDEDDTGTAWDLRRKGNGKVAEALDALGELICHKDASEAMEMAFGSDCEVVVGRDGEFSVGEYDHD